MRKLLLCLTACLLLLPAARAENEIVGLLISGVLYTADTRELDLTGLQVENVQQLRDSLRHLPQLTYVDLTDCNLSDAELDGLRRDMASCGVKVVWTLNVGKDYRLRTDAWVFSTHHSSKDPRLEDGDVACLRYATELRALDLGHNWIFDASFLEPLTQLRVLVMSDNRVTDFSALAGKPLEYLEIFNTRVEDLSFLQGCDTLMDLNICMTRVTDLSPLYELKGLKRLWVGSKTPIAYRERARFLSYQEENLEAYNFWTDIPTLYGWRGDEKGPGHPRYEIIKAMFHEEVYYDFNTVLRPEQYVQIYKKKQY